MRRIWAGASVLAVVASAAGCSRLAFWRAQRLERRGEAAGAAAAYRDFALKHPSDPSAPEAAWRSARLFAAPLGRCPEARALYEGLARASREPYSGWARAGLLECPDYFPTRPGMRWVLVDPQTGGKNMRQEIASLPAGSPFEGRLELRLFAGRKPFSTLERAYKKGDWRIVETDEKAGRTTTILRYPFRAGTEWEERREGRRVVFRIESDAASVLTRAGRFEGCLKVTERVEGYPSWKSDYYAPGLGRVLTTAGHPGGETPTAELLSVSRP